jgi:hypothetical protein
MPPSKRFEARSWRYCWRLGEALSSPVGASRFSLLVNWKWLASMSMACRFGIKRSACDHVALAPVDVSASFVGPTWEGGATHLRGLARGLGRAPDRRARRGRGRLCLLLERLALPPRQGACLDRRAQPHQLLSLRVGVTAELHRICLGWGLGEGAAGVAGDEVTRKRRKRNARTAREVHGAGAAVGWTDARARKKIFHRAHLPKKAKHHQKRKYVT